MAPGGLVANATQLGVTWDGGGGSYAVLYYDGKPHGVDRSPFYALARDHIDGSEIEREEWSTVDGHKAKESVLKIITSKGDLLYRRALTTVADDRTYTLSVTSARREDISSPAAEAFFKGFHATVPDAADAADAGAAKR